MQRFTKEKKLWAVDQRLNKKRSFNSIADQLSIHKGTVRDWVNQFSSFGATAFDRKHNTHYSEELKNSTNLVHLEQLHSIANITHTILKSSRIKLCVFIWMAEDLYSL